MLLIGLAALLLGPQDGPDFNRDIRPVLSSNCLACHGPDASQRKAGLRLDIAQQGAPPGEDSGGGEGPDHDLMSLVLERVTSQDPGLVMPPPGDGRSPLGGEEVALLRRWISEGAEYSEHWAFIPPIRNGPSATIDQFVDAGLQEAGIAPLGPADRRTLCRRLHLDLTGLPPTPEEVDEYLGEPEPMATQRLVDRLLSSPHFGEHMAKSWLDLVRFADTNGVHHDHLRNLSPYRDWVIRSFNSGQPYDQFVIDQLAGDLRADPTTDQLVASGFNRLHMIIDRGTALPEESLFRNVVDRVSAFGTAFLGLTVQCAVCHDHKYDPITQEDFYRLFAFFNSFDGDPETGSTNLDKLRGIQPPYVELPSPIQAQETERLLAGLSALPEEDEAGREALNRELRELQLAIPAAMIMKDRATPRPSYVLDRGAYDAPQEQVGRGTPGFLPPLASGAQPPNRLDLARWLVTGRHPLTARVAVNRIWQQLFGVGLTKTSEDLGTQGEWPSHPELLDELAISFVESGWDTKALIRRITLSRAYQRASSAGPEQFTRDPDNRLLARGSRYRLDAEVIRDQILSTSGLLNPAMFGPSVKPPQPPGIWAAVTLPSSYPRTYEPDSGPAIVRRSIYTFWKRGMPPPQMSILNAPTREACTVRRERTNTPLQALLLMNEEQYLRAAGALASMVLREGLDSDAQRVSRLYERVTSQLPDSKELEVLLQLLNRLVEHYSSAPELTQELSQGDPRLAAWSALASAVYNLDVTKTRQ